MDSRCHVRGLLRDVALVESRGRELAERLGVLWDADEILLHESAGGQLVEVKAQTW